MTELAFALSTIIEAATTALAEGKLTTSTWTDKINPLCTVASHGFTHFTEVSVHIPFSGDILKIPVTSFASGAIDKGNREIALDWHDAGPLELSHSCKKITVTDDADEDDEVDAREISTRLNMISGMWDFVYRSVAGHPLTPFYETDEFERQYHSPLPLFR